MRLPGREAPAWGRRNSSVGFSKTIPIPCGLSLFVGNATEGRLLGALTMMRLRLWYPRARESSYQALSNGHGLAKP